MHTFNKTQQAKRVNLLLAIASLTVVSASVIAQTEVVIEIHNTPSQNDDYLCWSPIRARARSTGSQSRPVKIVLKSEASRHGGHVEFSHNLGGPVSETIYSSTAELEVDLPTDGSWIHFYVNGTKASSDGKDVTIVAIHRDSGSRLGESNVMVRVRKNANNLQDFERDRFLQALAEVKGNNQELGDSGSYDKYVDAHGDAFSLGIHGGRAGYPLFLVWHRAFLLSFERELQEIDPRVTIPYWRFDEDSDNIFVESFMGHVSSIGSPAAFEVEFGIDNPLFGWRTSNQVQLSRAGNLGKRLQVHPLVEQFFVVAEELFVGPNSGTYGGMDGANDLIERLHHDAAHVAGGGVLNSPRSPADPVFFLLHANVDRVWAKWQRQFDRFDPANPGSYPLQGSHPGPSDDERHLKGSYALDAMWPWSLGDGSGTPLDTSDDWPGPGFEFPASAGFGPASAPTPASMIDSMDTLGLGRSHGVCYDDVRFGAGRD